MAIFSLMRSCPMKSAIRLGRTLASSRASSSNCCPERIRLGGVGIALFSGAAARALLRRTAQLLQGGAQHGFKTIFLAVIADYIGYSLFGKPAIIPEIEQCGDDVCFELRAAGGGYLLGFGQFHGELVAQLED